MKLSENAVAVVAIALVLLFVDLMVSIYANVVFGIDDTKS